ncbi:hypothetical protein BX616_003570, partial [Lobosporangium transversale]
AAYLHNQNLNSSFHPSVPSRLFLLQLISRNIAKTMATYAICSNAAARASIALYEASQNVDSLIKKQHFENKAKRTYRSSTKTSEFNTTRSRIDPTLLSYN